MHPGTVQCIGQTTGETVQPGLGRPVDIVRPPDPDSRHRTEDDQMTAALGAELVGQHGEDAELSGVVGMHNVQRMAGIGLGAGLITQHTECQDRDTDRSVVGDDLGQQRGMARGVGGIEFDRMNRRRAGRGERRGFGVQFLATPRGQDHGPAGGQPQRHLQTDFAASTQHQHGSRVDPSCTTHNHVLSLSSGAGRDPHRETPSPVHGTRYGPPMATHTVELSPAAVEFLTERHLATLTTLRSDGTPHVVPVGFTWDDAAGLVRVITSGGSVKARNIRRSGYAAVGQVDGRRWLTLEGPATVLDDPAQVREAERRYAERYRTPRENPARVVLAIEVRRVLCGVALRTA